MPLRHSTMGIEEFDSLLTLMEGETPKGIGNCQKYLDDIYWLRDNYFEIRSPYQSAISGLKWSPTTPEDMIEWLNKTGGRINALYDRAIKALSVHVPALRRGET